MADQSGPAKWLRGNREPGTTVSTCSPLRFHPLSPVWSHVQPAGILARICIHLGMLCHTVGVARPKKSAYIAPEAFYRPSPWQRNANRSFMEMIHSLYASITTAWGRVRKKKIREKRSWVHQRCETKDRGGSKGDIWSIDGIILSSQFTNEAATSQINILQIEKKKKTFVHYRAEIFICMIFFCANVNQSVGWIKLSNNV